MLLKSKRSFKELKNSFQKLVFIFGSLAKNSNVYVRNMETLSKKL